MPRSQRAAGPSPRAVEPSVSDTAVDRVAAARRGELSRSLGVSTAGATQLVAHVARRHLPDFSLLGVTWRHADATPAQVSALVRTRSASGWSPWQTLAADADGPSARDGSAQRDGTVPLWVDGADGVDVAVYAPPGTALRDIRVSTIDPGSTSYDAALPALVQARMAHQAKARSGSFPGVPTIITRRQWGADNSIGDECWDPKYGKTFKAVLVHHTAGSNDYRKRDSAAVVRGVYAYHVLSRGWCDIGYNFLVDRYGQVFQGRAGGIRRPVRGAHSGDYNVDTTGVSLMGNFDITRPTRPMQRSLVALTAWRLGSAYHGARGRPFLYDGRFNRISGHRDVMSTACPGRNVYSWLPTLRRRVDHRLGSYESRIEQVWRHRGGPSSSLGSVAIGEQREHGGHHTAFQNGRMYASPAGVFVLMRGPVLHRYLQAGGTNRGVGYPTSRVRATPTKRAGEVATFRSGAIYWSSRTHAELLDRGAILHRYVRMSGPRGRLGFPTGEIVRSRTGRKARFEQGSIRYYRSSGRTRVVLS